MACAPVPTETVFADVFTTTVIQTVSESVTVLPPTVTTLTMVSQSCFPPGPGVIGDGCTQVQVETTSTVDGQQSIVQVPVALTIQIPTSVPTTTLFAPCEDFPGSIFQSLPSPSSSPAPSRSDTISSSASTTSTDAWITTTVTPISISKITVDGGITSSDGNVYPVTLTMTSTFSPTAIVINSEAPHTTHYNVTGSESAHGGKSVVVPVVAGVLGGFFGFIGLVVAGWVVWRKRRAIFSDLDEDPKDDMGYYSPSHSIALEEPKPKPYQYGLVGRPGSHPSLTSPPSASSPELVLHHSYASLPYQDFPHNQPSSSTSQVPFPGPGHHQRPSSGYYGHGSSPSLAMYQVHSRTPTGNSTTPLLAGHLNSSEFGQITNASNAPGSRPSTAGRYDSAYSHSHQLSLSLPPGAAPPSLTRQSWPNQPNQENSFPEISPGVVNSQQSRNRSLSNLDLRHRNAESFPSSNPTHVSQGVAPSGSTGAPNTSQDTRVRDGGVDNSHNNGQASLVDDDVTPTLTRPHDSVLYVVNATSPRLGAGRLPS